MMSTCNPYKMRDVILGVSRGKSDRSAWSKEMSKNIQNTKALAKSHGLEFKDCGGGHVQIKGHGVMINYWPDSKARTVHIAGGGTIKHVNPFDAIKLCMTNGKTELKTPKKHLRKNPPQVNFKPVTTNPAGIKHFYTGDRPPWEYPTMIMCQSDRLRIAARKVLDRALQIDSVMYD